MEEKSYVELAPWPEREWFAAAFRRLDQGRSATVSRIAADNGRAVAAYQVCSQLWMTIGGLTGIATLVAMAVGVHHPPARVVVWVLFAVSAGTVQLSLVRLVSSVRLGRAFRAAPPISRRGRRIYAVLLGLVGVFGGASHALQRA